jgi:hypothetical protein
MIPREPGCYILNHISSGKFYIGSTVNLYERFHVHLSHLRAGIHKNHQLQSLYDDDQDIHIEFVTTPDRDAAYIIEQSELDLHVGHPDCLNRLNDAINSWKPGTMPRNWREATSERNKTLHAGNTYMSGKKHSPETIALMRERALARDPSVYRNRPPISEETREKLRIANSRERVKGRVFSDEHRANMRAAQLARSGTASKKVSMNGVVYSNAQRAAEAIRVTRRTIIVRIEDERFPEYFYLDS